MARRRWLAYPDADQLLICADGGGANGYRVRARKHELWRFAQEAELAITVCHLPPGTSKWNKIEHRLGRLLALHLMVAPRPEQSLASLRPAAPIQRRRGARQIARRS